MNIFYNYNSYKSIKILNENDYNTRRLYLEIIDDYDRNIIIKITKIDKDNIIYFNRIKIISELLNYHKNFIKVKDIFIYYNQIIFDDTIYNFTKDKKYLYICEIRDYTKFDDLSNYIKKLTLDELKLLLDQLISSQLHMFYLYGFLHNNITLDNIYYEDIEEDIKIEYFFDRRGKIIITKKIYKLSNYDYSILYNEKYAINYEIDYQDEKYYHYNNTLFKNIYKTINCCINLLKDNEDNKKFRKLLEDRNMIDEYIFCESFSEKEIRSYYNKYNRFKDILERCYEDIIRYLNIIWKNIFNEEFY